MATKPPIVLPLNAEELFTLERALIAAMASYTNAALYHADKRFTLRAADEIDKLDLLIRRIKEVNKE